MSKTPVLPPTAQTAGGPVGSTYEATGSEAASEVFVGVGWIASAKTPDGIDKTLRHRLRVEMITHPDGFEVSTPSVPASGTGDTWPAAIDDLQHTIWDLYAGLRNAKDGDTLHADARALRDRLRRLLG